MEIIKKYTIHFLLTILSIFLCILLTTTLYYFNIIPNNIYELCKLLLILLPLLVSSILLGKKATQKGFLEGMKLGGLIIILFTLISLITKQDIKLRIILYDGIILLTSILGGMIGINKK